MQRGKQRAISLIEQVAASTGMNAIALRHGHKAEGHLHKCDTTSPKRVPGHTIIQFNEIINALELATADTMFLVGSVCVERTH